MSDEHTAFPVPDWRPIAEIPVASRMAFALRAESGRIPTRARLVVEYTWDKDQLAVAVEAIADTIEQHFNASGPATVHQSFALAKLMVPEYGENLEDGVCKALHQVSGRLPSAADLRAAEAIRERFMLDVDLVSDVKSGMVIPAHKWAPELIEHIDWERSEHLWRYGPGNRKGHKRGYDIEGIEFDSAAAMSIGFAISQSYPLASMEQDVLSEGGQSQFAPLISNEKQHGSSSSNRGRRPRYDWPRFEAVVTARLEEEGGFFPNWGQADLEREMALWADQNWERTPGESTVRKYVKAAYVRYEGTKARIA